MTEEEKQFIIKYYPIKGKNWCCDKLGITEGKIRYFCSVNKIKLDHSSDFFKDFQRRAKESKTGKKRPIQSEIMKQKAKDGLLDKFIIATDEKKQKISEFNKKWIKENGHPKGMKGKNHTEEVKKIIKQNLVNARLDPNNYINSNEFKQIMSDKMSKQQASGILRNSYSRGKQGTYNINGKNVFFRSLWEANYALYLDFLINSKLISKWEFEVDTFWFEKIKRGVRSYKPDFKVYDNLGNITYHEVKGWMDDKSKTKLNRMRIYHPNIQIKLIEKKQYNEILKQTKGIIKFF